MSSTTNEMLCLSLEEFIKAPSKAESLLDLLTPEQIIAIENTLGKVKKRRLDKSNSKPTKLSSMVKPNHPSEPVTELKEGVEWVSFVYSHNRTLKRYSIRTDIQHVDIAMIDDKFKSENCVYPRANLPKEDYHGNRWTYETECNGLGWKLAWLNKDEIAGKRGLIQRAVDSYRNRYPSMRSRRVARQEKLLNGTLRKRKHREDDHSTTCSEEQFSMPSTLAGVTTAHHPKTIAIEDVNRQRLRIKINVESVDLDEINIEFRKANCPFPRVMNIPKPVVNNTRWLEETMCNELAWKLAWLNPRHLAGKKNMLQRALDIYRSKFMPSLQPRKNSNRAAPIPPPSLDNTVQDQSAMMDLLVQQKPNAVPLTADALSAQNALYEKHQPKAASISPVMSSGTTESLDFADCISVTDEETSTTEPSLVAANAAAAAAFCDLLLQEASLFSPGDQESYSISSASTTPSPTLTTDPFTADFFDQFMVEDPFYLHANASNDLSKLYNTSLEDTLMDSIF